MTHRHPHDEGTAPAGDVLLVARRAPIRANALAFASRVVVVVLVAAVALAGIGSAELRSTASESGEEGWADPRIDSETGIPVGTDREGGATFADVLGQLLPAYTDPTGQLLSLALGGWQGRTVDVRLVITVSGNGSNEVDRVVDGLRAAGIDRVSVRSLTSTPAGTRVELTGTLLVSTRRLPASDRFVGIQRERAPIALTGLVVSTGAALTRLDMPSADGGPVRLSARGSAAALIALLDAVEKDYSAPSRVDELRVESGPEGTYDLSVGFRLRETASRGEGGGA